VCVYVCVFVHVCMGVYGCGCELVRVSVRVYVCACGWVSLCVRACVEEEDGIVDERALMYKLLLLLNRVDVGVRVCACVCRCIYVCVCVCVCVCVHACVEEEDGLIDERALKYKLLLLRNQADVGVRVCACVCRCM